MPLTISRRKLFTGALAASVVLLLSSFAVAQNKLYSVRIGAKDIDATAKFYETVFGMQETNRITIPGGTEIFMNFGATPEEAKANKGQPILIMHRDSDDEKDPMAHVLFSVSDMSATVAAVKAAGGTMMGDPRPYGKTGMLVGAATDPAGNHFELLQFPPKP